VAGLALALASAAGAGPLLVERDVTVGAMRSDRFTWLDAGGRPRVAVLAHNDGQVGPAGSRGGELREYRYETPDGTRIVTASDDGKARIFDVASGRMLLRLEHPGPVRSAAFSSEGARVVTGAGKHLAAAPGNLHREQDHLLPFVMRKRRTAEAWMNRSGIPLLRANEFRRS
jgi:hypothetical protein